MNLSKQTSDAIQMLACCYRAGEELVKVAHIANELDLTKQMALKLANILSQAGLVETFRGPSGGIRLTEETKDTMLGEIVRRLESAPSQKSVNPHGQLDSYIDDAFEAFLEVLDRNSLHDIAMKKQRRSKARKPKAATKSKRATSSKRRPVSASRRPAREQRVSRI
ncbi:MAG: Rrf2 family transcriptional regulator [Pseudomonadota bacterium]